MSRRRKMAQKNHSTEEIGHFSITDTDEIVFSIVDDKKLDIRVRVDSEDYKGWTKRGIRFSLFESENWKQFKELVDKTSKIYKL